MDAYTKGCDQGVARGCTHLGMLYAANQGVPLDPARATQLFERACAAGDGRACHLLGEQHPSDQGRPSQQAAKLFASACRLGSLVSCGRIGAQGRVTLARQCRAGKLEACAALGDLHDRGVGGAEDPQRAARLYEPACNGGNAAGCNNLGRAAALGRGRAKDSGVALELFEKACKLGSQVGCTNVALSSLPRETSNTDWEKATTLLVPACAASIPSACHLLAYTYTEGYKDYVKAAPLYQWACANGQEEACARAGALYLYGQGVAKDVLTAALLLTRSCDKHNAYACYHLGHSWSSTRDGVRASAFWAKSCSLGAWDGCVQIGLMATHGDLVPTNHRLAAVQFEKACEGKYGSGCTELGVLYEHGLGVTKDFGRAAALYQQGCSLGDGAGCTWQALTHELLYRPKHDPKLVLSLLKQGCTAAHMRLRGVGFTLREWRGCDAGSGARQSAVRAGLFWGRRICLRGVGNLVPQRQGRAA